MDDSGEEKIVLVLELMGCEIRKKAIWGPGFGQDPRPIKSSLAWFNHPAICMVIMAWLVGRVLP